MDACAIQNAHSGVVIILCLPHHTGNAALRKITFVRSLPRLASVALAARQLELPCLLHCPCDCSLQTGAGRRGARGGGGQGANEDGQLGYAGHC